MLWVIFALISPLLWSINGIVNKFMISKITKSTFSFYILSTFVQTIVVILAVLFFPLNLSVLYNYSKRYFFTRYLCNGREPIVIKVL